LETAFSCIDDLIGVSAPDKGFCFGSVVLVDKSVDCGLEVNKGMEDAAFQASLGQLGEEAFKGVGPGA
jgi:hypothetical protein